jgi:hypothetical protein
MTHKDDQFMDKVACMILYAVDSQNKVGFYQA